MSTVLFKIGCDPELMLINSSNKLKSAIPVINGSKYDPQIVTKGAILSDNVNFEFNVIPSSSGEEFVDNIRCVLKDSVELIAKKKLRFVVRASANFPKSELKDPRSQEFGCEPDYNAWTMAKNFVDDSAPQKGFRSAGGHIHIGIDKGTEFLDGIDGKINTIKAMDAVVGIISVIIDNDKTSIARRKLYGTAGAHRPKNYGVEYRAIGNFWVKSPFLVNLIYDLTKFTVNLVAKNKALDLIAQIGEENIINTINLSDTKRAFLIYSQHLAGILPESIKKDIEASATIKNENFYQAWNF